MLFVTTLHGKINIPTIRIAEEMLNFELFEKIRQEHGLAYHVDVGRFRLISFSEFSVELEGVKRGTEKRIEKIFDKAIEDLIKNTLLFERFRKKSASVDLIPDYSPFTIRRGAMSDVTYEGRISSLAHDRRQSASVKFEEVQEVLNALRPQNRLTNIITS
jgi:predicted Zn-dependent peptidase